MQLTNIKYTMAKTKPKEKRMQRKGQFEVLGIALIVLLLLIGVLFAIYLAGRPEAKVRQVEESILAGRWITTLLETTDPGCFGNSMKELLQTCVERELQPPVCDEPSSSGDPSYCAHVDDAIRNALQLTFVKWNRDYRLTLSTVSAGQEVSPPRPINSTYTPPDRDPERICLGELEAKLHIVPLRIPGKVVKILLQICR